MTDVLIRTPSHPDQTLSIEERGGDPEHLTREERDELISLTRWTLGDERLWTSTYHVGGESLDYDQLVAGSSLDLSVVRPLVPALFATDDDFSRRYFGNTRTLRDPRREFVREREDVTLRAVAQPREEAESATIRRWTIDVTATLPDNIASATFEGEGGEDIRLLSEEQEGSTCRFHVEVTSPRSCRYPDESRTYIEIPLRLRGPTVDQLVLVPVDHGCLLGDTLESEAQARLTAISARPSPAVLEIANEIRLRLADSGEDLDLEHAWEGLKCSVRERGGIYLRDPFAISAPMDSGDGYVYQPDETLRYGGDCEDWAILVAGVLRELGFETHIVDRSYHVNVEARDRAPGSSYRILDIVLPEEGTLVHS